MAMALGPPQWAPRVLRVYGTLYSPGSGFVRWFYSTERAVSLHARRFANTFALLKRVLKC